jgi:hypothetical protein
MSQHVGKGMSEPPMCVTLLEDFYVLYSIAGRTVQFGLMYLKKYVGNSRKKYKKYENQPLKVHIANLFPLILFGTDRMYKDMVDPPKKIHTYFLS